MRTLRPFRRAVLLVTFLMATPLVGDSRRVDEDVEVDQFLRQLQSRYGNITSVHMRSRFTMTIFRNEEGELLPEPVVGSGEFEYWAEGTKYRFRYDTDSQLDLLSSNDVAYNGSTYQRYLVADDVLSLHTGDKDQVPAAISNPFFLPVDFLTQDTELCPFCILKLHHLAQPSTWEGVRQRMTFSGEQPGHLTMKAEGSQASPGSYEVAFEQSDGAVRITRLKRRIPAGDEVDITFSRHTLVRGPGLKAEFPMVMDLDFPGHDGSEIGMGKIQIIISTLHVNQPIDDQVFELDQEAVRHIWSEDSEEWLKHPASRLLGGGHKQ
jgi:hypothetical protein